MTDACRGRGRARWGTCSLVSESTSSVDPAEGDSPRIAINNGASGGTAPWYRRPSTSALPRPSGPHVHPSPHHRGWFLVGGDAEAARATSALLGDLGARHTRCGQVGAGNVVKVLSNLQVVVGVAALAEAVATARAQGVDDDVLTAVFGDSVMVSQGARFGLPAMLDPEHRGVLGPVGDAVGVVRLALGLAHDVGLVLSPAVLDLLGRVADPDWPDFSAIIEGLSPESDR